MVAQVYKHSSTWEHHTVKLQAQEQAELYKKEKHYLKQFQQGNNATKQNKL